MRSEQAMLSPDMMQWSTLVLVGAALLLVHFSLLMRTVRMPGLTPLQRIMTLALPPATPLFAFSLGAKRRAVLWWVLTIIYGCVRYLV